VRELAAAGFGGQSWVLPRIVLAQLDTCDPMVQGWERAERAGFPTGWERDYPILEDPQTMVTTLATGNPATFPILAPIVRRSGGGFVRAQESDLVAAGQWLKLNQKLLLGPASITCLLGFEQAAAAGLIHDGDLVVLNTGEGAGRAPDFAAQVNGWV